jgi:hypothetical protein
MQLSRLFLEIADYSSFRGTNRLHQSRLRTYDNLPLKEIKERYDFTPTPKLAINFLDKYLKLNAR